MKKSILIIEDNSDIRENIVELLTLSDYQVWSASDGKEGVRLAKQYLPHLIVCDIMMPELDGYGVLNILQKDINTAVIPFIFLTAKADKSDIRKGILLGADDYITKPFEEAELLDAIDTRFRKIEQLRVYQNTPEDVQEFLELTQNIPGIGSLTQDRKPRVYDKKQVICHEGGMAQYMYYVVSGKVKCAKTDTFGKDLMMEIYQPHDFFGYQDLLMNGEHSETAVAMEKTELLLIPKQDFDALIQKNRDVAIQFIKLLANRVQEKENRLLRIAFTPVRERTAHALLDLKSRFHSDQIKISREDLASIVGTATESLIRTLSEFKDEGLVEMVGRDIKIMQDSKLSKIAGL